MPKFTQIGANASPAVGDYIIGHTAAGVDDKITIAQLAALVSANLSSKALIDLGYNSTAQAGAVMPTAYTTVASVTATSHGGAVRINAVAAIADGSSGASRTGNIRLVCDGVAITNTTMVWQTVNSGQFLIIPAEGGHTPAAGSHTWGLQVVANTASGTVMQQMNIWVAEAMP